MHLSPMKWLYAVPLCLGATLAMVSAKPPATCAAGEAASWVENHRNALPTTLAGLDEFNIPYRKAIYARLTGAQRASLWHEQLADIVMDPTLTSIQRTFLVELSQRLDRYFGDPVAGRDQLEADSISARAVRVLGRPLYQRALVRLGSDPTTEIISDASAKDLGRGSARVRPDPTCDCNTQPGQDYCDNPSVCLSDYCYILPFGCGLFEYYPCNGLCERFD